MTRFALPSRLAAALATVVTLAFAGQGCGVMSSGECIDKATCAEADTGSMGGPDATQVGTEGGPEHDATTGDDDGPTAVIGDDATVEADTGRADGPGDTGPTDAGVDRAAETGVDSGLDTGVDTGVDTGMGAPDGCVPTGVEDCSNGLDDNCDGKVDCADPQCQPAFTCAPVVPAGWVGPIEFWQASNPATAPNCDLGYGGTRDGQGGLATPPPAMCGCSCRAMGQTCSRAGSLFQQTDCAGVCATVTPDPNGACTAVPAGTCGSEGSFELASAPTPSGGTCLATPSTTLPPLTWATSDRVCAYSGLLDSPGGCTTGARCVRAPAGGASGYGTTACVYSTMDPPPTTCPAGYAARAPVTYYAGATETRGCVASCTCSGTPSNGSCSGTIDLYGNFPDAGCTGAHDTYAAGGAPVCQCFGQAQCGANDLVVLNNAPGFVQANYTVTPGTCGAPAQPLPTGTAVPATPTTVCCM